MDARIHDLPFDPAVLHHRSPGLINSHHQNNHGGVVKRVNAIRAQLANTALATAPGFQLNGLKREELVYCLYGHEVGRATAMRLRAAGLNARYLQGGIDGWQAAGRLVVDKPASRTP